MKTITKIIFVLLFIDVITTVYALAFIPGAHELNPLLTAYGNIYFNVIISHILIIPIILWAQKQSYTSKKMKRQYTLSFTGLSIFLGLVVLNNLFGIGYYYWMVT